MPIGCAGCSTTTCKEPAAAIVSGLPLLTKPLRTRLRLMRDVIALMQPGAPFVQFTYGVVPPIPKTLAGITRRSVRA